MSTLTETTAFPGQSVHNNTVHDAAQGTSSCLVNTGGSTLSQPGFSNKASYPFFSTKSAHQCTGNLHEVAACIAQTVLKRGRPSNAEKALKAAQRAAASVSGEAARCNTRNLLIKVQS